jgi:simple sugar transport system substrate-binding protein
MRLVTRKIEDHDDPALAYQKTKELIAAYPNLRGILGISMTGMQGAGKAISELGLQEKVMLVGTGLVSACGEHLKNGANRLISFWDPADAGYVMNQLAIMVLRGEAITEGMNLGIPGYTHITLENNIIYGSAWIDVTRDTMAQYQF